MQVHSGRVIDHEGHAPGIVTSDDDGLVVACGRQSLMLETVQLAGGKPIAGASPVSRGVIVHGGSLGMRNAPSSPGPLVIPC